MRNFELTEFFCISKVDDKICSTVVICKTQLQKKKQFFLILHDSLAVKQYMILQLKNLEVVNLQTTGKK
ncbi:hypothetical protein V1478_018647 [Vespula squamosa]|uniref:Uncharacterized protein n=1 Tax=Vespula squamosa TaxID=30214 RepID=A0ABD1ZTD3_VESSQ